MKLGWIFVLVLGMAMLPISSAEIGPNDLWKFNSPLQYTSGVEVDKGISLTPGIDEGISLTPGIDEGISLTPGIDEGISLTPGIDEGISLTPGIDKGFTINPVFAAKIGAS